MLQLWRYFWAFPGTAVGLPFVVLALGTGGRVRRESGVLEACGGILPWCLRHLVPIGGGASAMTLGHVVLGIDERCLIRTRDHERVHVRQYEVWGPAFIPAYLLASVVLYLRGADPYLDNPFERAAYSIAP